MAATPLISIVVPVYNVEAFLDKCLASILNQTFSDFEVLLVDDGSTDGSGLLCETWGKADNRIKVFHKINGGLSDARNYALDRASGQYITCVDSDDYLDKDYLDKLIYISNRYPDTLMVGCSHYIEQDNKVIISALENREEVLFDCKSAFESVLYSKDVDVSAWGKLYHRSLFDGLRYPKNHLYEDTYIFGDLLLRSGSYAFLPQPLYHYVKRSTSIVAGGFSQNRLEYIDSVERLTGLVAATYPELEKACVRRKVHARLSVLRYMENCDAQYRQIRVELRNEVLKNCCDVLFASKTPIRDKVALLSLCIGFKPFYLLWNAYERLRWF